MAVRDGLKTQAACDLIDDFIVTLPALQRRAATLRWLFGWPTNRIAEYLSVAPGTIKSALFRSRHKLLDHLQLTSGNGKTDLARLVTRELGDE